MASQLYANLSRPQIPGRVLLNSTFVQSDGTTTIPDPVRWTNVTTSGTGSILEDSTGDNLELVTGTSAGNHVEIWATQQRWPTNIGLLVLQSTPGQNQTLQTYSLRAASTTVSSQGVPNDCYGFKPSTNLIEIVKISGGTQSSLASLSFTPGNSLYWIRFECIQNTLRGRMWLATADERTAVEISVVDTSWPNAGMAAVTVRAPSAASGGLNLFQYTLYEPNTTLSRLHIQRLVTDVSTATARAMAGKADTSSSVKAPYAVRKAYSGKW